MISEINTEEEFDRFVKEKTVLSTNKGVYGKAQEKILGANFKLWEYNTQKKIMQ